MAAYRVDDETGLIRFALERGWVIGGEPPLATVDTLPQVGYWSGGDLGTLPAMRLATRESAMLRIPEAVIHGRNFSLVVGDRLFPGGFVHSYHASPAWTFDAQDPDVAHFEPQPVSGAPAGASLVGVLCHFGHFFVDALDRLFALEAAGRLGGPLLVSDRDFFALNPKLDERHAVPQVSQIIELLGMRIDPSAVFPLDKARDHAVTDLWLPTLQSNKPAVSVAAYRTLRERVWTAVPDDGESKGIVFVGRADVRKRFVRNQEAVLEALARRHGVQPVFPEHLTAAEAVKTFRAAAGVILPVGSAKFNLAFCRPGTKVVCVTPKGYAAGNGGVVLMTRHICHGLGLPLAFYDVEIEADEMLLNSNLIIDDDDVDRIMDTFEDL